MEGCTRWRFSTAAPQRRRRSVERYNLVKGPGGPFEAHRHRKEDRGEWKKRASTVDLRVGPKESKATILSVEAAAVARGLVRIRRVFDGLLAAFGYASFKIPTGHLG